MSYSSRSRKVSAVFGGPGSWKSRLLGQVSFLGHSQGYRPRLALKIQHWLLALVVDTNLLPVLLTSTRTLSKTLFVGPKDCLHFPQLKRCQGIASSQPLGRGPSQGDARMVVNRWLWICTWVIIAKERYSYDFWLRGFMILFDWTQRIHSDQITNWKASARFHLKMQTLFFPGN